MSQSINVNTIPDNSRQLIHVSQYDVGRTIKFKLFENSIAYTVPTGATVKIQGTKPSGLGFSIACAVNGNEVTATTTEAMTQEWGSFPVELQITKNNDVLGTVNFILDVEKSPHPENTTDGTLETIPELTERLDAYEQIFTADIAESVSNWLDEHPEATTTVEDGSITEAKLNSALAGRISAVESGVSRNANDIDVEAVTRAAADEVLRQAIDDAAIVPAGSTVVVDSTLTISGAAADAKVTGDNFTDLKSAINNLEAETRNLLDVQNWISGNGSMSVTGNVASNIQTDSKTNVDLRVYTRSGTTNKDEIYAGRETIRHKKFTFTATADADAINIWHSGSTLDLAILLGCSSIESGKTYTLSFDITGANPSVAGGFSFKNIQLEEGSTETKYIEQHITAFDAEARESAAENIADITHMWSIVNGLKNHVDKSLVINGAIQTTYISTSAYGKICLTHLTEGKQYALFRTIKDNRVCTIAFADAAQAYANVTGYIRFSSTNGIVEQRDSYYPFVFTVPAGYPYFAIQYYSTDVVEEYTEEEILNSLYIYELSGEVFGIADHAHKDGGLNPIYAIFSDEIKSVSQKIAEKATSPALLLGIITDTHIDADCDVYNEVAMQNMKSVNSNVSFDILINMGDLIDGGETKTIEREFMRQGIKRLIDAGAKNTVAIIGNHDNNGLAVAGQQFSEAELYGMMLRISETTTDRDGIHGNAYIDYPNLNLRVLFVDSVYLTQGFSTDTVTWVSQTLANAPNDYKFVFISHEPTRWSLISTAEGSMTNSTEMEAVLTQYVSRICGWIHGHTHFDNVSYVMTFPEISITCGRPVQDPSTYFPSGAIAPERTIGNVTQDAWDAVLVLPNENKFEFVRFGAGNDRTVPFRQS